MAAKHNFIEFAKHQMLETLLNAGSIQESCDIVNYRYSTL